tara:strand:- start:289 stop:438 length:150 start_codon:yes stop_codon:yes gene_type:complete
MVTKTALSFSIGLITGVFLGQNYNIPDVKKLCENFLKTATILEKQTRKN